MNRLIVGGMGRLSLADGILQSQNSAVCDEIMAASTSDSSTMTDKTILVYDPKPLAYKAVRVWLSDGSRMLGMWTGTKWWSLQGEIRPVRWELEERKKKKTDKLRKVIAKKFA
jgi:hypothetical protein